jgi:hypothetical protein
MIYIHLYFIIIFFLHIDIPVQADSERQCVLVVYSCSGLLSANGRICVDPKTQIESLVFLKKGKEEVIVSNL